MAAPGVLLVGDAAGLASKESGEGIRPAIESGLLAASVLVQANGRCTEEALQRYRKQLNERFAARARPAALARLLPRGLAAAIGRRLLDSSWFVRHVVLDRWFLHVDVPALALARTTVRESRSTPA